jgi:hypothetical protein
MCSEVNRLTSMTGISVDWLSPQKLAGKSIKVRIVGSNGSPAWENGAYEGRVGCTVAEHVEDVDGSRRIRVKLMTRVNGELLVPDRYVLPIHPDGIKEKAVIIVGEDVGVEGTVIDSSMEYWHLHSDSHSGSRILYFARREHMAVLGKRPLV